MKEEKLTEERHADNRDGKVDGGDGDSSDTSTVWGADGYRGWDDAGGQNGGESLPNADNDRNGDDDGLNGGEGHPNRDHDHPSGDGAAGSDDDDTICPKLRHEGEPRESPAPTRLTRRTVRGPPPPLGLAVRVHSVRARVRALAAVSLEMALAPQPVEGRLHVRRTGRSRSSWNLMHSTSEAKCVALNCCM